jgi:hypothetical protein
LTRIGIFGGNPLTVGFASMKPALLSGNLWSEQQRYYQAYQHPPFQLEFGAAGTFAVALRVSSSASLNGGHIKMLD